MHTGFLVIRSLSLRYLQGLLEFIDKTIDKKGEVVDVQAKSDMHIVAGSPEKRQLQSQAKGVKNQNPPQRAARHQFFLVFSEPSSPSGF